MNASRLRALELQGYKTFAAKTSFEFSPTITTIVGPNGSGKSNIADAIRWVLGEQSYRLLRGHKTEDMIFSGSESRPRAGMAYASITFDNSDGWLPIDFSEVTIGRRAYRDSQNEYLLNGQRVRLKDISELLAQSGLSERTYTIIGQGLVDAALSLRAEERRRLFEEAAGIELYRVRREETLRRLETTRRNLERVQDILTELKPRLRSLERQAKRAGEFDQIREDLKQALRTWYGYHWYRAQEALRAATAETARWSEKRTGLKMAQEEAEEGITSVRINLDRHRRQLQAISLDIRSLYGDREAAARSVAVATERLTWLEDQAQVAHAEIDSLHSTRDVITSQLAELGPEMGMSAAFGAEPVRVELQESQEPPGDAEEESAPRSGRKNLEATISARAAAQARLDGLGDRLETVTAELQDYLKQVESMEAELRDREAELQAGRDTLERSGADLDVARSAVSEAQARFESLQVGERQGERHIAGLREQKARAETRWKLFLEREDQDRSLMALQEAVRDGRLRGLMGIVSRNIQIAPGMEPAVEAALGEFSGGVAVESFERVLDALRLLDTRPERLTARFVAAVAPGSVPRLEVPEDPDCLGLAVEFVEVRSGFGPVMEALLARTLVVKDRQSAIRHLGSLPLDARVVTQSGEVYSPTGLIFIRGRGAALERESTPGKAEAAHRALEAALGQAQVELEKQRAETERMAKSLEALHARKRAAEEAKIEARALMEATERSLADTRERHAELRARVETFRREESEIRERGRALAMEIQGIDERRGTLEAELAAEALAGERGEEAVELLRAQARREALEYQTEELRRRLATLETDLKAWHDRLRLNAEQQTSTRSELESTRQELAEADAKLKEFSDRSQDLEEGLTALESSQTEAERKERRVRSELSATEERYAAAQISLARREEELSNLEERIHDDFGLVSFDYEEPAIAQEPLPLAGIVEKLTRIETIQPDLEVQVNRLRAQLRRLGAVNPEAQREYREVRDRVRFLSSQMEDLQAAEAKINEVIGELDSLMDREFRRTFDAVAVAFREAFERLFGGGAARLILTDPSDLTSSGIEIEARLPGRRPQELAMLSGGERSLTASALIFALLKTSPTPFCVLDEVDAMLDEANVLRFCEMLRELSQNTQFIVITHNRQTVQTAEVVYGVSMQADSVSKVISLKMDDVEQVMAA